MSSTERRWPPVLTIAGSDSGGGAGIQADLKTFAALRTFGTSAITAITAQNTVEVRSALHLPPELVVAQIQAVVDDIQPKACKTGMLANAAIVHAVADTLERFPHLPAVVDPVAFTSTGYQLLTPDALDILVARLFRRATLITPNLREATAFTGVHITTDEDMRRAAEQLLSMGAPAVLVKGGHRIDSADDLLSDGGFEQWFRAAHIDSRCTHGTGCSLSAAIAAGLAKGLPLVNAVDEAKMFVHSGIAAGYEVGAGHAPINHFFECDTLRKERTVA
jgi:hydroxymethylpyrimidine/phosphomethylpyrimidine kinase